MPTWELRATSMPGSMVADLDEVRRGLELFTDPEYACELMALKSSAFRILPASDLDKLALAVDEFPSGIGIYFRLNPIPFELTKSASNADVIKRRWIYVDVDRHKEKENDKESATEQEKVAAGEVADKINRYLMDLGWPAPIVTDSGNGYGLFWRCDLPNDKLVAATCKKFIYHLAKQFTSPLVEIDKGIHNANRLVKVPGTWARKGTNTEERPHRPCRLLQVPAKLELVTFEQIQLAVKGNDDDPKSDKIPVPSTNGTHSTHFTSTITPTSSRTKAYAQAALNKECASVALMPTGNRNNALNTAAFCLGTLVGAGVLNKTEVENALIDAARQCGLDKDDGGEQGVLATIHSGLTAGMAKPRSNLPIEDGKAIISSSGDQPDPNEPLTVKLSEVKPTRVDWLVPNRIPKRFITVFAGRTGVGKSFVSHDLIARLSRGDEIPFSGGQLFDPGGTLILSEDSPEYVLAPRLIDAGADLSRIHAMTWKAMNRYSLGDTAMLDQAVNEVPGGVSLVLIDPPTNFLVDVDEHKNSEVRQLVMKVVEWAFKHDLAVLFILHVNKQSGKGVEALNRVMGSVAWVTTSRIAHTLCPDPNDATRCLWVPIKNNLGKVAKALAYRIVPLEGGSAKVEWIEEVDVTADQALGGGGPKVRRDVAASQWLIDRFREKLEWKSDDLFEAAKESNVGRNAVFEAKKLLKLPNARRRTTEGGDTYYVWWVPADWEWLNKDSPTHKDTPGHRDSSDANHDDD